MSLLYCGGYFYKNKKSFTLIKILCHLLAYWVILVLHIFV